ncbi:hypothetical protein D3C77_770400 [compost metagenome]
MLDTVSNSEGIGDQRFYPPLEQIVELAQPIQIQVDNAHVSPEAQRYFGRIDPNHSAADDRYFARLHTRHTA